jgi:plasmid stabilization system protein ParE
MNLVLRPAAAADLDEAFLWYESQREGLGEEFLVAVTRVMEVLAKAPGQYPVVHRETRRALVRRFPYSVFYRVVGSDVVVVGCFHGSRDPRRWRNRS